MVLDVESAIRKSLKQVAHYRFHRDHGAQARRVLQLIEKQYGRADPANLKLADVYAREVFGDGVYAPWLRVYAAFRGTFKEGWIPDNFYGSVVVPKLQGGYGKISHLKPIARLIFNGDEFPDLAYFANGLFFTGQSDVIPDHEVKEVVFRESDRVVFKLDGSRRGNGVFFLDRTNFD